MIADAAKPHFGKIALIGIGLIGSSLARAIRRHQLAKTISISTRSEATLERARELDLGDSYTTDAAEAVADADLVIVSVPVGASGAVAMAIAPALKPSAIVTDVGSTKASVIDQMQPYIPDGVHFIPGHPIAGTEYSGPDAGFATLFEERWCILTPLPNANPKAVDTLANFWRALGSDIETMDPAHHDQVLALVSHLPQLVSYNIVATASEFEDVSKADVIKYSASGFRDFTRLASSDPVMWRDVCLHNKEAILEMLARFSEDLSSLRAAIRRGDAEALQTLFTKTRDIRQSILEAGQDIESQILAEREARELSPKTPETPRK
ncbi:MAG: prephenate/arogenate dehydrogenase family protein [Pseudomonadota bacterium]